MRVSLMLVLGCIVAACDGAPVASPTSPAGSVVAATVCAPSVTLSSATFTETGGQSTLAIRTPTADCQWRVTMPEWVGTTSPTTGSGNADLILTVARSDADRIGTIAVGQVEREVRQQTKIKLLATCFSGRPGELVLLACTATIEYRPGPIVPIGRPSADFTALGKDNEVYGPFTAGNYDWDVRIPADQPVGTVTIPMRVPYGDGFVATAVPQFSVLPPR